MKIEDQVVSLELATKLKEVGVEQRSYFKWEERENGHKELYHSKPTSCSHKYYSAFTASELLQVLPHRVTVKENEPFNSFRFNMFKSFIVEGNDLSKENIHYFYIVNYECDSTECTGENAWLRRMLFPNNTSDKNAANAFAKALIKLIEHGYFKV